MKFYIVKLQNKNAQRFCYGAGGIRLPALGIVPRAFRPPARCLAHPCAKNLLTQGFRLEIITATLRFESLQLALL